MYKPVASFYSLFLLHNLFFLLHNLNYSGLKRFKTTRWGEGGFGHISDVHKRKTIWCFRVPIGVRHAPHPRVSRLQYILRFARFWTFLVRCNMVRTDDVGQGGGCPKSQFLLGRLWWMTPYRDFHSLDFYSVSGVAVKFCWLPWNLFSLLQEIVLFHPSSVSSSANRNVKQGSKGLVPYYSPTLAVIEII